MELEIETDDGGIVLWPEPVVGETEDIAIVLGDNEDFIDPSLSDEVDAVEAEVREVVELEMAEGAVDGVIVT